MSKLVLFCLFTASLFGQGLHDASLLRPPTKSWPSYNGDYSGRRFSTLAQINQGNIRSLTLAWAFQTHQQALQIDAAKEGNQRHPLLHRSQ